MIKMNCNYIYIRSVSNKANTTRKYMSSLPFKLNITSFLHVSNYYTNNIFV